MNKFLKFRVGKNQMQVSYVSNQKTNLEAVPAAHSSYTGSPAPPGWHIHMCDHKKVCCVFQHSLKNVEKIPGDGPLHKESWRGPLKAKVSGPLCKEEEEEHSQSPT